MWLVACAVVTWRKCIWDAFHILDHFVIDVNHYVLMIRSYISLCISTPTLYMYFSWWRNIITPLLMRRKCRNDCIIIMFIMCLDNDKLLELTCTIWSIRFRYYNLIVIIIIFSIWFFECYNQIVSYSIIIKCIIVEIIQLVNVIYLQHSHSRWITLTVLNLWWRFVVFVSSEVW